MKNIVLPLLFGASVGACTVGQKQPNVLIILTDDQGWGDVGIHGNPLINTPTLDKLYRQSAVLNHFYSCPLSATSRASLLTGRYHLRTGVSHVDRGLENMNPEETTIAEVLKERGYQTGCFGKWHNGAYFPYTPNGQGFDEFVGFSDGLILNYFDPLLQHNEEWGREKGFITDIFTDKAIRFIEKNKDKPFLCYIPYNAPHAPYQVPDAYFDRYTGLTAANQRDRDVLASIYAMVENVDYNISRILDKLDELKIAENTLVVFMSDNGPTTVQRYNGNMRGQKSTVYEGGIRVPCFIRWKGKINHRVIDEPTSIIDIMPTLLGLCGFTSYQTAFPVEGIDLKGLIHGETERLPVDRMIFTHVWSGSLAPFNGTVRTNDYRLSLFQNRVELYHINADPGEKENLYEQDEERAKTLHETYLKWFNDASKNVKLNPLVPVGYDEARTVRIQAPEGKMNGQLAYYSRIPNRSWVHRFETPDDYLLFELEAVHAGNYEIAVEYAQPGEGKPVLVVECGSTVVKAGLPYCTADSIPAPDRVPRWQAHERDWGKQPVGVVTLPKGQHVLKLYAENTLSSDIQINTVLITRKE